MILPACEAVPKVNSCVGARNDKARTREKYNILKSTYSMKLYIVFLIDLELLFRQPL